MLKSCARICIHVSSTFSWSSEIANNIRISQYVINFYLNALKSSGVKHEITIKSFNFIAFEHVLIYSSGLVEMKITFRPSNV